MRHLSALVALILLLFAEPAAGAPPTCSAAAAPYLRRASCLNGPLGTEPVSELHVLWLANSRLRFFALGRYARRFGELGPHADLRLSEDGLSTDLQTAPLDPMQLHRTTDAATRPSVYAKAGARWRFGSNAFVDVFAGYQTVGERGAVRAGFSLGIAPAATVAP